MGALTLKVFSDELREWEFIEGEGIDPTDSFGVNLRLSIRENQIFLAEPSDVNTPWITDKGRLFFDGLFDNIPTTKTNWEMIFNDISELLYFIDHLNLQKQNASSFIFIFDNLSLETLNMLYLLTQSNSIFKLRKAESQKIHFNDLEFQYQLSSTTEKPKLHMSSLGLLINVNPRYEGYVLNLNLRQRFLKGDFKLFSLGSMLDLTFPVYHLGSNLHILKNIGEGTHLVCQDIKNADFPTMISNSEFFKRSDSKLLTSILKYVNIIDSAWNGFNVLNNNLSNVGVQSLNKILPVSIDDFNNFFGLYCINVSLDSNSNIKKLIEIHLLNVSFNNIPSTTFIDQNNKSINKTILEKIKNSGQNNYYYLPNNLFLEDNETYINTQGLIKRTTKLINFKKDAKTNWQIIRKLFSKANSLTFLNNKKDNNLIQFDCVNSFNFKNYIHFQFYAVKTLTSLSFYLTSKNTPIIKVESSIKNSKVKIYNTKIKSWLDDFFNNNGKDSFSYNSSVLLNCLKISKASSTNFF